MTEIAVDGEAKSATERTLRIVWQLGLWVLTLLVVFLAFLVAYGEIYRPGDDVGYYIGLLGGLMMLSLLLYPLRKRMAVWDRLGLMTTWFRYHMVIGIVGPVLIIFHSTFRIGSMNGRVALYSTLLVAASGVVGRFVYRHIHQGLYGRRMTLAESEEHLEYCASDVGTAIGLVPKIGEGLRRFHEYANRPLHTMDGRVWRFLTLRWRARRLADSCYRVAKKALKRTAREQSWSRAELRLHWRLTRVQVSNYLEAVCSASQFTTWEKLFSVWHVVHVPFIYLLVICGIVHVVAVHMY